MCTLSVRTAPNESDTPAYRVSLPHRLLVKPGCQGHDSSRRIVDRRIRADALSRRDSSVLARRHPPTLRPLALTLVLGQSRDSVWPRRESQSRASRRFVEREGRAAVIRASVARVTDSHFKSHFELQQPDDGMPHTHTTVAPATYPRPPPLSALT